MKEHERLVISGLVVLLLILWLGFVLHSSPRFAGSFWGGLLGLVGALLMLVPLVYMIVKRIKALKKAVTKWVSMRTLLSWHIYSGIFGPILVILHTGHKFESVLGIALTALTLLVVASGFIGRYLMSQFSSEIREKKEMLGQLEVAYQQTAAELATQPKEMAILRPVSGFFARLFAGFFVRADGAAPREIPPSIRALRLAETMADLEYAIRTHELFKRWFGTWLKFHIIISFILYFFLALHVWAGVHFGLRWFA